MRFSLSEYTKIDFKGTAYGRRGIKGREGRTRGGRKRGREGKGGRERGKLGGIAPWLSGGGGGGQTPLVQFSLCTTLFEHVPNSL